MLLCHKNKSVLTHHQNESMNLRVCNFTAKERESYHSMRLGRAKARQSWCKLGLERTASAPRGRRFLEVPLKYHSAGWEHSKREQMEIWPKQVMYGLWAKGLCSPGGRCLLAGRFWRAQKPISSTNMVQAWTRMGQRRQPGPRCSTGWAPARHEKHEGSQEHPPLLMDLTQSRNNLYLQPSDSACLQTKTQSRFSSHRLLPCTSHGTLLALVPQASSLH